LGCRDDVRTYGDAGTLLVRNLYLWLQAASQQELNMLQGKLRGFFAKVNGSQVPL